MSSVVLDSREDVLKFLQILAEESVSSARETIEKDTQQEKTIGKMKMDSKTYDLSEQPEAADEDEVVDSAEEEEVDASVDEPSTEESLEVSLDSIISAVNQLRGGRSTGDLEIKDKLRTYFDRLDETERVALLTFLKAFSGILTGAMDGNSAPDPSDPPLGIAMSSDSDEEAAVEDDAGAEAQDTTPPIKAGETQELAEIRKRVRKLMSKR